MTATIDLFAPGRSRLELAGSPCEYRRVKSSPVYARLVALFRKTLELATEAEALSRSLRPGTAVGDWLDYPDEFRDSLRSLAWTCRAVSDMNRGELPPAGGDES